MAAELPQALMDSLQTAAGFQQTAFEAVHASREQVVSVRLNPAKIKGISDIPFLENIHAEKVPWNEHGYYLTQRPLFTIDPLFHAGAYYVQEASSMFLESAMKQVCDTSKDLHVLDLCAAPGGKSTLLQSVLTKNSLLVSNEVIKTRAGILAENISKWGAANVVVTNNDPKEFKKMPSFFDCIVIDAPCSGSGMFRKDPEAINEWSLNNVELCSQRQQRILADVMDSLKPGGILMYSTCSYSKEEDELIADWLVDQYKMTNLRLSIKDEWGIVESVSEKHHCYGYRFYPDKVKGEGFFIAVFQKSNGETADYNNKKSPAKNLLPSKKEIQVVAEYLKNPDQFSFLKWQEDILAVPASIFEPVVQLQQNMYVRKAGINMGNIIRDELIPSHELIISTASNGKLPVVQVETPVALDYLRRKDIHIDTEIRGWAVISYESIALGLVKILPNRLNNYYPKDWRILNK